ncbi:MAG TPA: hypothetical protein DEQ02_08765, partial [Ruminococcaceae bacterium]|nr:hypothetical protein [Oscillospiraceae bacterium]
QAIKTLNGLTTDSIYIGQVLTVPGGAPPLTYTVQPGDTLWRLAQRFGTTVQAIKTLNDLTIDSIYIGQVLYIR